MSTYWRHDCAIYRFSFTMNSPSVIATAKNVHVAQRIVDALNAHDKAVHQ